jgi:hypothetical protein
VAAEGGESSSYIGSMQAGVLLGWVCSMCGSIVIFQCMDGGLPCCVVMTSEGYALQWKIQYIVSCVSVLFIGFVGGTILYLCVCVYLW